MNNIARKLVLSALTVVLVVVALGTTTFAWFTLTNTAVIQSFNAEIIADSGIEIALSDGVDPLNYNWKTTITTQDVYDYMAVKYGADILTGDNLFRFNNVTSTNGRVFTNLNAVPTTDGYLELKLHFRSEDATAINWTNVTLTSTPFSWTSGATFTNEHGDSIVPSGSFDVNAVDAIRISVTGAIATVPTTTVYENAADATNVVLGELTAADLTGTNGAVSYYTAVTTVAPNGVGSVTVAPSVTSIVSTKILDMVSGSTATAGMEFYGQSTIRIYFEGWDANAYNSLLAKIISVSFRFEA